MTKLFKILIICFLLVGNIVAYGKVRYELPSHSSLLQVSEEVAMQEMNKICTDEDKLKYLRTVGVHSVHSWCAAGQYWSFLEASKVTGKQIPFARTGVANQVFNSFQKDGVKTQYEPRRGDFIIWTSNSWQGHIERILEVQENGWVKTIAFNTSYKKGRGNAIKLRNLNHPLGKLRLRGIAGFRNAEEQAPKQNDRQGIFR